MEEIWKDIPGYEGLYQASNLGNIKSIFNNKILKFGVSTNNYYTVNLWKNKKSKHYRVHTLIAITFLNHTPNKQIIVIDHIDNNKTNNRLENLQLISQRHNSNKDKLLPKSGVRGVYWSTINKKWQVRLRINGKKKNILYHDNKEYCGYVYKEASKIIDENKHNKTTDELKELIKEYKLKIKNYDTNK